MPIRIVCEKRHHKGEPDISYPAVFCDICDERIKDAREGGYFWNHPLEKSDGSEYEGDQYYEVRSEPFFLHGTCNARLYGLGDAEIITKAGRVLKARDLRSQDMPLDCFPLFLARNLKMRVSEDVRLRRRA